MRQLVFGLVALVLLLLALGSEANVDLSLHCTSPVKRGFTSLCTANVQSNGDAPDASEITLWPTVNGLQWCAQTTIAVTHHSHSGHNTTASRTVTFRCPYPLVGPHEFAIVATQKGAYHAPFPVGRPIPKALILGTSNNVTVEVQDRPIQPPPRPSSRLISMQWEPWFTSHNNRWTVAEAVPTLGYYSSFDANVIMQHAIWLTDIGVDYIMVDWTNNLWNIDHWSQRGVYAQELINATTFTLQTYKQMRQANMSTPSVVLLLGLDNGPQEPLSCLQEEIDWITQTYLPKYRDLLFTYEGKPLLIVFDGGGIYDPSKEPLSVDGWTLRLMATQLQQAPFLAKRGYWSWMDGRVSPVVVRQPGQDVAEVATATCAFFPPGGWFASDAMGKRQGATLVQEMASMLAHNKSTTPRTLVLNQWNEFAGQPENSTSTYVDIYNATLGNDMEPTSLTECAYHRPNNRRCGGWGFRYLNLLRALIAVYTGADTRSTILTVARPINNTDVAAGTELQIEWAQVGAGPCAAAVYVDATHVGTFSASTTTARIPLSVFERGRHTLRVQLPSCETAYPIAVDTVDVEQPAHGMSTPSVAITFHIN